MPEKRSPALTRCKRCGDICKAEAGRSTARPFRKALRGYCPSCVVCRFFQEEENGVGFALAKPFDPEGLRLPRSNQKKETPHAS